MRILATSRKALAVPGEVQLPVTPLAVPVPDTPAGQVADFAAARLFLDRAAAVVPDLVFDPDALGAVALICRRLDGIPVSWPVVRRLGFTVAVRRPPASMGRDPPLRHATQPQRALGRLAIKLFH